MIAKCHSRIKYIKVKVEEGRVELLDSLLKKDKDYTIAKGIVNR